VGVSKGWAWNWEKPLKRSGSGKVEVHCIKLVSLGRFRLASQLEKGGGRGKMGNFIGNLEQLRCIKKEVSAEGHSLDRRNCLSQSP